MNKKQDPPYIRGPRNGEAVCNPLFPYKTMTASIKKLGEELERELAGELERDIKP